MHFYVYVTYQHSYVQNSFFLILKTKDFNIGTNIKKLFIIITLNATKFIFEYIFYLKKNCFMNCILQLVLKLSQNQNN